MFRATLATTCPVSTAELAIDMVLKRRMIPLDRSVATLTAVCEAPKPAHSTMMPGTT